MTKVLIVDDAQFLRVRLGKLLKESGYDIIEAEDGVQAVSSYKENSPDVVFMDITMPHMDGLDALKDIRASDANARVVMLTALGQEAIVLQAVKSGAKDFVVKPFDRDRVLSALQKALA